ncbi:MULTISPECIES: molecular chaperone HtpG [Sphingobacterium]|jgi:molecular chaperone HtpG|uniref:Chaperone protein HtpG n=1 Tax=Sphingobacterium multivorum TaxID=28454 RepID=A0A654DJK9_SPHMU|nr:MULTISPECIES: molecular chaperone HtpG [Sphingobacterium]HAU53386.1 molecular chaperone HtpG [Sphingobacterium sp.]OFV17149.1 molecular chaperone HtpG [Sphingobacterium sp. HMSC13C05]QQT45723.1 molecular chaperone HtpG [Sphingobacterium multivorum]QQT61633.1 molecular chaperone HtpG [Sphingobacterium multivorum]QRQ63514.1 molecular chaperone HtpG [Sphingobacterium multivorum]
MNPEKGSISIHTENIFPVIKKFLYSDNEIFLRELVSNAVDASQKIKRLASLGQYQGETGELIVDVKFDEAAKTITISDNGIGMTADEIKKYINQIAFSGATEFMEKFKEANDANEIIGRFGLGFYSAFMVADTVEIQSLSYQDGAEPAHWTCDGSTSYEISTGSRTTRGTDVILHINEESTEFLSQARLQDILDKYAKFLPVSIRFGTKTNSEQDGEDEEGKPKYKSVEVDNIINNTNPAWTKSPSELKDEDYLAFYRELYPYSMDEPLFWIHLNVDYPFNLTGILYFPKVKNELEIQRNKIKLYSRQVFITDEVKDIVPEFLMLLHGVIDSPDIPLNVSRSFLQADSNVKKINSYITKKVADKLNEIFKTDRKGFEEKWTDIGLFIKYGMLSDEKFAEKANDFCLVKNTGNQSFTIKEYYEKVKDIQVDKDGNIVYLYTHDAAQQDGFIQTALNKGYDVLMLDGPLDTHFAAYLEQKGGDKVQLKRVDADVIDKLIQKDEKVELALSEEESKKALEVFEKAISRQDMKVEVDALNESDLPVSVTIDEFMRRMKDMAKTGGGMNFYGSLPDNYKVTVNGNHPLIKRILSSSDEEGSKLAKQAFDLALLSRGLLSGADLTSFVKRSVEMI